MDASELVPGVAAATGEVWPSTRRRGVLHTPSKCPPVEKNNAGPAACGTSDSED
nr:MAG TPA: hypothetical protein [Caudoviricetes sp.]